MGTRILAGASATLCAMALSSAASAQSAGIDDERLMEIFAKEATRFVNHHKTAFSGAVIRPDDLLLIRVIPGGWMWDFALKRYPSTMFGFQRTKAGWIMYLYSAPWDGNPATYRDQPNVLRSTQETLAGIADLKFADEISAFGFRPLRSYPLSTSPTSEMYPPLSYGFVYHSPGSSASMQARYRSTNGVLVNYSLLGLKDDWARALMGSRGPAPADAVWRQFLR